MLQLKTDSLALIMFLSENMYVYLIHYFSTKGTQLKVFVTSVVIISSA